MKIKEAIEMANLMEQGNVLPRELAILFLSELDGMIQSDIMLHAPEEIVNYTNEEQELLLRPPHDKLYVHYLVMMIRNQQQEYEGYQNSQAAVDEKLKTFRRWYVQHYRPADTASRSYTGGTSADAFGLAYLTAYGLAVKHGYGGTEEEWLKSLIGPAGKPARMRYDADLEVIQWGVGEVWYDLFTLAQLRDPAIAAFLAEAEAYRDQAQAAAEAADEKAQAAQHYALNAGDSATMTSKSTAAAQEAANLSAGYADDSRTQAETAGNYAKQAKAAAERVENAQGSGGIAQETDPTVPEWAKQAQKPSYTAEEVGALPDTYTPPNQTAEQVGADPKGTAAETVTAHNLDTAAHNDLRLEVMAIREQLAAFLDVDEETLNELSELIAAIAANQSSIQQLTAAKVNVADIVDNLETNVSNKPLSAAMGVTLYAKLTNLGNSLSGYQPKGDYALTSAIPTKVSQLTNDKDYLPRSELTGYATEDWVQDGYQPKGSYLTEAPVTSVNGKTGAVKLTAADVGAMSASGANGVITNLLEEAKKSGEFDGEPGADGRGIKSITRTSGNGAAGTVDTYTIAYTDNTTSTFQMRNGANGAQGPQGIQGEAGKDGVDGADGVGISKAEQTTTSTADGGSNVFQITLSNGATATFTVKNGTKGSKGDKGDKGDTGATGEQGPQGPKGDTGEAGPQGPTYTLTDADKQTITAAVVAALPKYAGEVS